MDIKEVCSSISEELNVTSSRIKRHKECIDYYTILLNIKDNNASYNIDISLQDGDDNIKFEITRYSKFDERLISSIVDYMNRNYTDLIYCYKSSKSTLAMGIVEVINNDMLSDLKDLIVSTIQGQILLLNEAYSNFIENSK